MFIRLDGSTEPSERTKRTETDAFEVFWEGTIFLTGKLEGEASVRAFIEGFDERTADKAIADAAADLHGAWILFIRRKSDSSFIITSSNEHVEIAFIGEKGVSNSLLRLFKDVSNRAAVDDRSVVSLLSAGYIFSDNPCTIYKSIRMLEFTDYCVVRNGATAVHPKEIPSHFDQKKVRRSFLEELDKLMQSFKGSCICLDLSGGTDSRTLCLALYHLGYQFECASNGATDYSEVRLASEVTRELGLTHRYRDISEDDLTPELPRQAWAACNGLGCILKTYAFENWRKQFNYSVAIAGISGELYKDGGWYFQALPLMATGGSAEQYIDRLVHNGYMHWAGLDNDKFNKIVSARFQDSVRAMRNDTAAFLKKKYAGTRLGELADRTYHEYSTNALMGTGNNVIPRFLPLQELTMMRVGVNQPWYMRVNHMLYRMQVGGKVPRAAKLHTDRQDMSLSPNIVHLMRDYGIYAAAMVRWLTGGGIKGSKGRNRNTERLEAYLRSHPDMIAGLTNLKDNKILKDSLTLDDLNLGLLQRALTLHYIMSGS